MGFNIDFLDFLGWGTAQRDRDFNSAEAQKQRDFEREMSNTAYQRGVSDMEKAGINPAMVYSGGSAAASTPSGASASSSAVSSGLNSVSSVVNSAANLAGTFNNDRSKKNDIDVGSAVSAVLKVASILGG